MAVGETEQHAVVGYAKASPRATAHQSLYVKTRIGWIGGKSLYGGYDALNSPLGKRIKILDRSTS